MNALTKRLVENFEPILNVVCYKSEGNYYLESHQITEDGKMMEGKPLASETMLAMMGVFFDQDAGKIKITGLVPENLLFYEVANGGEYQMIWWQPEQIRNLFFSPWLHIPSGEACVPAMVFKATKKGLNVYALNSNNRPDEETVLYKAPFHNVSDNGIVCLGSAKAVKAKESTYSNFIKYWEQMWWGSTFTHLSGSNPTKTNVNLLWIKLREQPNLKWSALDELEKSNYPKTLKDIIK